MEEPKSLDTLTPHRTFNSYNPVELMKNQNALIKIVHDLTFRLGEVEDKIKCCTTCQEKPAGKKPATKKSAEKTSD